MRKWILLIIGLLLLVYPWVLTMPFAQHLMIMVFLYALLGEAWNILGGYAGQVSLGHAVYFGVGAYTSTLLLIYARLSPWLGMLLGAGLAVGIALIIGYPCFRLRGHYFAIATIAVGEIVAILFANWDFVRGASGVYLPLLEESWLNFEFHAGKLPYYYIAYGLLAAVMAVTFRLERSKVGYYLRAIKEDQEAAQSVGVNAARYKLIAIAISAFFTALGGTFYAQYILYIDPESVLPLSLSIQICLVAVLGGTGTLWGPVLGAFILVPLSEITRVYLGGTGRAIDLVIYGFLIMLVAVFQPAGLMGLFRRRTLAQAT
jgi:branched-chain amino acid transport system permease protein